MHSRLEIYLTPAWAEGENRYGTKAAVFEAPVFDGEMGAWKCVCHVDGEAPMFIYGETAMQSLTLAARLVSRVHEGTEF